MRKNMNVLLITLTVGVYFSFVPGTVRAELYTLRLTSDSTTDISTRMGDTGDYTFTLNLDGEFINVTTNESAAVTLYFTYDTADGGYGEIKSKAAEKDGLPSLSPYSLSLVPNVTEAITVTVPRKFLSKAGKYFITVFADETGGNNTSENTTIIINVGAAKGTNPYEVSVTGKTQRIQISTFYFLDGFLYRLSNTGDANFTLVVENAGANADQIDLTVSGQLANATLSPTPVSVASGAEAEVTLTIPRASLLNKRTKPFSHSMIVTAVSKNDATVTDTFRALITIIDDRPPPDPTQQPITGTPNPSQPTLKSTQPTPVISDTSSHEVVFSEFMFEPGDGEDALPRWIEVYNNKNATVNLRGWKLDWKWQDPSQPGSEWRSTTTLQGDFIIPPQQPRLIVTTTGRHAGGINLSDNAVYQLDVLHASEPIGSEFLIVRGGFSLKLTNAAGELIDQIGTLYDDPQSSFWETALHTWELPKCLIDGVRTSLIRRFDDRVPRSGIEKDGWIRAFNVKQLPASIYYGHQQDLGTPGYRRGKPLPVELSQFSAKFVQDEVVISWTTESELDNAGFNIYRSTSPTKNFQRINAKLIRGAGTTGKRSTYQFIDKTAKPNVAYYYRIEDVDLSGKRVIYSTYRLRGIITPTGKHITTWGTLKDDR